MSEADSKVQSTFNPGTVVLAACAVLSLVASFARGLVPIYFIEAALWAGLAWYWQKRKPTSYGTLSVILLLVVIVAAGEGYSVGRNASFHNVRSTPWDKSAIEASMVQSDVLCIFSSSNVNWPGPAAEVSFYFDLLNRTNVDYTIGLVGKGVIAMQRLRSNGALIDGSGLVWRTLKGTEDIENPELRKDKPILLPSGQTVRVVFILRYHFFGKSAAQQPTQQEIERFGREQVKDIAGFVLLDEAKHYQIELLFKD